MSDNDLKQAYEAISGLDIFSHSNPEKLKITRLGGLTNLVFKVADGTSLYCLRLPGKGTDEYIDRAVEAVNAKAAARAGVSPEVLYSNPKTGLMITRFLDGFATMSPELFATTNGAPARAGKAFARLHNSGEKFSFRFELFSMIDEYLGILAGKDVEFPDGYHQVLKEAEAVREVLAAKPGRLAPCHCDPLCENFLDDGNTMWIIDWEYSGMNDPLWDLADLSVEGGFSEQMDLQMLNAYFPSGPDATQIGRMVIYKAMCDLLWTLWGLIQHANDNPAEDFKAYSVTRFIRCRKLMDSPDFNSHIKAVRNS